MFERDVGGTKDTKRETIMHNGAEDTMRDTMQETEPRSSSAATPTRAPKESETLLSFGPEAPNQITLLESSIALIRLGTPGEQTVLLTEERLEHLSRSLEMVLREQAKGVIITGLADDLFSAGADIAAIERIQDSREGQELSALGQTIFDRIERFPVPVVAAISGPCLGGALELALACTARIASDRPSTKFGLPEVKIGIIPGFGGTQRLPRLIGLPKAMQLILTGRLLGAREAMKAGLVSQVVPMTNLIRTAEAMILEGTTRRSRISLVDRFMTFTPFGRTFVKRRCEADLAPLHGHYPAPAKAIDAVITGLERGVAEGLRREAQSLGELIVTAECQSLVKLFFLTEAAKKLGRGARRSLEGLNAVVLGAGEVGAEVTVDLARREFPVILRDGSPEALTRAMSGIRQKVASLPGLTEAERSFIINRINPTNGTPAAVGSAQVVLDSSDGSLATKQQALAELASIVQSSAVIATTGSTTSIEAVAANVPHPERCLGMHFFPRTNGSYLVEIVRTPATSNRPLALAAALVTAIGRYPVIVDDVQGCLVQRIRAPYLLAALRLLCEGHSVDAIDTAATSFGFTTGPFRYLDQMGLDNAITLLTGLHEAYGERMAGGDLLAALRAGGRPGEAGKGAFYDVTPSGLVPSAAIAEILHISPTSTPLTASTLLPLLVYPMVNEAVRCLDEGVAGAPGIEAGFQIDLASVFGCGFPPFRGGILHYADRVGAKTILPHLHNAERAYGPLFKPTKGLAQRSASGRSLYDAIG